MHHCRPRGVSHSRRGVATQTILTWCFYRELNSTKVLLSYVALWSPRQYRRQGGSCALQTLGHVLCAVQCVALHRRRNSLVALYYTLTHCDYYQQPFPRPRWASPLPQGPLCYSAGLRLTATEGKWLHSYFNHNYRIVDHMTSSGARTTKA